MSAKPAAGGASTKFAATDKASAVPARISRWFFGSRNHSRISHSASMKNATAMPYPRAAD